MKYTIEQVAVKFVEILAKKLIYRVLKICQEFSARRAIATTAISARMAAVARPPDRSDVSELLPA